VPLPDESTPDLATPVPAIRPVVPLASISDRKSLVLEFLLAGSGQFNWPTEPSTAPTNSATTEQIGASAHGSQPLADNSEVFLACLCYVSKLTSLDLQSAPVVTINSKSRGKQRRQQKTTPAAEGQDNGEQGEASEQVEPSHSLLTDEELVAFMSMHAQLARTDLEANQASDSLQPATAAPSLNQIWPTLRQLHCLSVVACVVELAYSLNCVFGKPFQLRLVRKQASYAFWSITLLAGENVGRLDSRQTLECKC